MRHGQPTPHLHPDAGTLAYPRPYPLQATAAHVNVLDRAVAREALMATVALVLVVLVVIAAIGVSGWFAA